MKKLPPGLEGREIFSEKSGQLVQLQGQAALLAGSGILVQNALGDSLVNDHDSVLVSSFSSGALAGSNSSFELLKSGLHSGLVSLVLLVSDLGAENILLRGLDVCQCFHLPVTFF